MNAKKVKKLRKEFLTGLYENWKPQYNIRGEVVRKNLWKQFKNEQSTKTIT